MNDTIVKDIKVEDMDVEEDEIEEDVEDYKQMIANNLAERDAFLKSLEIDKDVTDLKEIGRKVAKMREPVKRLTPKTNRSKPNRNRVIQELPRREPSRRLRKLPAPGEKAIALNVKEELLSEEEKEEKDERLLESVKLEQNDVIFSNLGYAKEFSPDVNLKECSLESFTGQMRCMRMSIGLKVVGKRIQSAFVHPTTSKCLSFVGSKEGELGVWDSSVPEDVGVITYKYHRAPINCISTDVNDTLKLLTISHDGTFCCLDLEKNVCDNVYATDFYDEVRHLTWHDQIDAHTFLLAHGSGRIGTLDKRSPKVVEKWEECFARSCRTVQHNSANKNHVLVSSGTGGCIIYDVRKGTSKPIAELVHPKGLTSAFFSPNGRCALTTCNDDKVRVYEISDDGTSKLKALANHNNHTGRWLTVFRAMWFPQRSDAFHIGSLLAPRRIQIFDFNADVIASLEDEEMSTIQSVQACHPTLPVVIGANSTGRVHLFKPPSLFSESTSI